MGWRKILKRVWREKEGAFFAVTNMKFQKTEADENRKREPAAIFKDTIRFAAGYMQHKTRAEIIAESESHFRACPGDLAEIVLMYGKRENQGSMQAPDLKSAAAQSHEGGAAGPPGLILDDDYREHLLSIYKKFQSEGLL